MENILLNTIEAADFENILLSLLVSFALGILVAAVHSYRNLPSRSFKIALSLLPAMVQVVIMMVNGNIGAGLAVAGAFTLVRFRSATGNARDIVNVFLAVAIGLSTGMHEIWFAVVFTLITCGILFIYARFDCWDTHTAERTLKILAPPAEEVFAELNSLLEAETKRARLVQIKATEDPENQEYKYDVILSSGADEFKLLRRVKQITGSRPCSISDLESKREKL